MHTFSDRSTPRLWLTKISYVGKNESEEKRELIFKEDGQGETVLYCFQSSRHCFTVLVEKPVVVRRVCTSLAHAWQWTSRGTVHRWNEETLSYQRQNEEEGLGEYGQCACCVICGNCMLSLSACSSCWEVTLQGDIILVGLRDYQDEKADVILK